MHILLCSATEFEIRPLLESKKFTGLEILFTGVGLTAATYSITRSIMEKKPRFILQAGVAGCLDKDMPLSKTFIVENEFIGDQGVYENGRFHSLSELNLLGKNEFPFTNGRLKNNFPGIRDMGLPAVDAVTVNEISTHQEIIQHYRQLGAVIETMEGAALHYVALQQKIPFLQVRSLSNFIGERDKSKWQLDAAISTLNKELEHIISKIY